MSISYMHYTAPRVCYGAILHDVPANVATDYWFEFPEGLSPTGKSVVCSLDAPHSTKDYSARVFATVQNNKIRINIKTDVAQEYYIIVEILTKQSYLTPTTA